MTCDVLRIGDIKTILKVTIVEDNLVRDVSSASLLQIKLEKPISGTVLVKDALLFTDGTDGVVYTETAATDLDEVGDWRIQAYVESPTWTGHSSIGKFKVKANLS